MKTLPRNSGFSLIEVMCAILILGVALVGLTTGITTALSSGRESELQTTAVLIAAGQIEMIQANGFLSDGVEEGDCGDRLSLYRWKQSINSTPIAGLHEIAVTVENSKSGKAIYELRTMLFDPVADRTLNNPGDRKGSNRSKAGGTR